MIPAATLAHLRSVAEASCPDTAQVQRNTPTQDIWGHQVDSYANHGSPIAVRVATPNTPQFRAIAEQLGVVQAWKVSYSVSADVREGDRLVIGSDTLQVHTIASPQSYNTLQEAVCTEVK